MCVCVCASKRKKSRLPHNIDMRPFDFGWRNFFQEGKNAVVWIILKLLGRKFQPNSNNAIFWMKKKCFWFMPFNDASRMYVILYPYPMNHWVIEWCMLPLDFSGFLWHSSAWFFPIGFYFSLGIYSYNRALDKWSTVRTCFFLFYSWCIVEAAFCVRDNVVVSFHQCWNHKNHWLRMNFIACMQTQRQMKSKKFRNVIMLEKTSNCTLEFHSTMEFFEYVENRVRPPLCSLSISSRRIKLNLLNAAICHICSNWQRVTRGWEPLSRFSECKVIWFFKSDYLLSSPRFYHSFHHKLPTISPVCRKQYRVQQIKTRRSSKSYPGHKTQPKLIFFEVYTLDIFRNTQSFMYLKNKLDR